MVAHDARRCHPIRESTRNRALAAGHESAERHHHRRLRQSAHGAAGEVEQPLGVRGSPVARAGLCIGRTRSAHSLARPGTGAIALVEVDDAVEGVVVGFPGVGSEQTFGEIGVAAAREIHRESRHRYAAVTARRGAMLPRAVVTR